MLEHLDREFKIILNMLKVVLEKVDIIHKQTNREFQQTCGEGESEREQQNKYFKR